MTLSRSFAKRSLLFSILMLTSSLSPGGQRRTSSRGATWAQRRRCYSAGIIAYHVIIGTEVAADAKPEDYIVQFGAVAAEESIANELIGVVTGFSTARRSSHLYHRSTLVLRTVTPPAPFDPDEELARSDIDITLHVHFA
jgi:hypothetical protein